MKLSVGMIVLDKSDAQLLPHQVVMFHFDAVYTRRVERVDERWQVPLRDINKPADYWVRRAFEARFMPYLDA